MNDLVKNSFVEDPAEEFDQPSAPELQLPTSCGGLDLISPTQQPPPTTTQQHQSTACDSTVLTEIHEEERVDCCDKCLWEEEPNLNKGLAGDARNSGSVANDFPQKSITFRNTT